MTSSDPANPSRLLLDACDVVEMIAHRVGTPEACLRRGALERAEGARVGRLLAALEAMMRRILVILAFALMPGMAERTSKSSSQPAGRLKRKPPPRSTKPTDLQARFDRQLAALATARFRMLTPQVHPWESQGCFREWTGRATSAPRGELSSFVRTERLARRYAAVLRVLADSEPHAKRLCKQLARLQRPHDHAELSRNASHLDIDVTLWRRGVPKSRERRLIERHPCRRAQIAASAKCVALSENHWNLKLPYLAGG